MPSDDGIGTGCRPASAKREDSFMREHPSPEDITNARFEGTGYSYTLSLIQGKHKMAILYCLMEYQPVRFNRMKRYLGNVADKTLSANLKELERDGLVARAEYPQVPPKVEYTLTELGDSLMEVLDQLCLWGTEHMPSA